MTDGLPTIVVSGYASVDYAMQLAPFEGHDATTLVCSRADEWPRYGGIAHVTRAAARAADGRLRVSALSWVGPDAEGEAWMRSVERGGADTAGVSRRGTRSPSSHLLYPEGQGAICIFDAADCHGELDAGQRELLSRADALVVTVGPAEATRRLIDEVPSSCTVLWVIKQDPASLTEELAAALGARADVVTLSEGELAHLAGISAVAREGSYIVVTRGSRGAELQRVGAGGSLELLGAVPAHPVSGVDTTGAGDTFSGTLAALLAESRDPEPADAEPANADTDADAAGPASTVPEPDLMLRHLERASRATADMLAARLTG